MTFHHNLTLPQCMKQRKFIIWLMCQREVQVSGNIQKPHIRPLQKSICHHKQNIQNRNTHLHPKDISLLLQTNIFNKDTQPWKMQSNTISVVKYNDHLGQIVSGRQQEIKNIDLCLSKARKALFSLLGPGFSYKCLLGPSVKLHLYRTFICPVLRTGLSTFVLSQPNMNPIILFQRKTPKAGKHF